MAQLVAQRDLSSKAESLTRVFILMQAFNSIDSNKDRRLSKAELALGYKLTDQEVQSIMGQADTNKDGVLSLAEFLVFKSKEMNLDSLAGLLKSAFESIDANGDGVITVDELYQAKSNIGAGFSLKDCVDIIASMDENGDGGFSPQELEFLLNSLI